MSYCYIPTNAGADAFSNMEQDVEEKVYFAGEVQVILTYSIPVLRPLY